MAMSSIRLGSLWAVAFSNELLRSAARGADNIFESKVCTLLSFTELALLPTWVGHSTALW